MKSDGMSGMQQKERQRGERRDARKDPLSPVVIKGTSAEGLWHT